MRKRKNQFMSFLVLAAVVSFMLIFTASNSLAITISGTVTDSAGTPTPLPGIAIGLFYDCYSGSAPYTGVTDGSGNYSIDTGGDTGPFTVCASDNPTDPACGTNWVSECWNSEDKEPHTCYNATSKDATTSNVDFTLLPGYSITGTVYDDTTPVPNIIVNINVGDSCDGEYIMSVQTDPSGDYCMTVPAGGPYYLYADPAQTSQDYAQEWFNSSTDGTFYCQDAEGITVTTSDLPGTDFYLDDGGSISGTVKDNTGAPVAGVIVTAYNDALEFGWTQDVTDTSGNFTLPNLAPGPWEISIQPDPSATNYVHFNRDYWLELAQDRNLGTLSLQQGALITGTFKNTTAGTIANLEYWYGGKFEIGWSESDGSGNFQFRLPLGTSTLNVDPMDSGYTMVPVEINVTDVGTPVSLGDLTAYDDTTGNHITGAVTDSAANNGQFQVVSFLTSQDFSPDKAGSFAPLGAGGPDLPSPPGTGNYSMFVPPSQTVDVSLVLYTEDVKELESITVVSTPIIGLSTASNQTGQDFTYNDAGYTVDGYVKDSQGGIYRADVLLYKQPGDEFAGFADSDETGYYKFYNVPAGDYKIAAIHPEYPDETAWSDSFPVSSTYSVDPIYLGAEEPSPPVKSMPWLLLLLESE